MNKILITGHPRSGTMYISKFIKALGYRASFEGKGWNNETNIVCSWKHIKSGIFYGTKHEIIKCNFDKIIHQIRHPLQVIASSVTLYNSSMGYINKFVYLPDRLNHRNQSIRNCMYSYYGWNKLIEEKAIWRYKIEDLPIIYKEWTKEIGIEIDIFPRIPKANTRKHPDLTWEDLFKIDRNKAKQIEKMAIEYGYKE